MRHRQRIVLFVPLVTLLATGTCVAQSPAIVGERFWPTWRGPLATGVAPHADPPIEWSETKNVRWKIELPGKGHSSPVIWGDRVFLTAAVPMDGALEQPIYSTAPGTHDGVPVTHRHQFVVMAISRTDGKVLWRKVVREAVPHEGGHYTASLASNSPVTDGEHVFASFGSYGLYCFDLAGRPLWEKDFGMMQTKHGHGEGASPAVYGDTLVFNWDHEGQSFIAALDKATGDEKWKVERDEVTSWSTPIFVEHDQPSVGGHPAAGLAGSRVGQPQVIVNGTTRIRGYNLETGAVIWECGGLSANVVASPVAADGLVFAGSSYEKKALLAIRLDGARGDVTRSGHVLWRRNRGTPYVPSLLLYGDSLYFLSHYQGVLSRVDLETGVDQYGPFRLVGFNDVYASPVAAAGRVYVTDRTGITVVISHDDDPRILAANRLTDRFSASAAIAGGEMYLRGERHLYCIAEE